MRSMDNQEEFFYAFLGDLMEDLEYLVRFHPEFGGPAGELSTLCRLKREELEES